MLSSPCTFFLRDAQGPLLAPQTDDFAAFFLNQADSRMTMNVCPEYFDDLG